MVKVSVRITGLKEILEGIDNVTRQDLHDTKARILEQSADIFVSEWDRVVHVITGQTKSSIIKDPVSNDASSIEIHAEHGAYWEELRGGDHAGGTIARDETMKAMPAIIIREYENMFNKNRASTPKGSKFF
jgi:hypothetical protein